MNRTAPTLWLLAALILLAGCSSGSGSTVVTVGSGQPLAPTAATPGNGPAPGPSVARITSLCQTYCDVLLSAQVQGCPDPQDDLSRCSSYFEQLFGAVTDIDDQVSSLEFGVRDYPDLLDATRSALREADDFVQRQCHLVTSVHSDGDLSCAIQVLQLRAEAAMVGLWLRRASSA